MRGPPCFPFLVRSGIRLALVGFGGVLGAGLLVGFGGRFVGAFVGFNGVLGGFSVGFSGDFGGFRV